MLILLTKLDLLIGATRKVSNQYNIYICLTNRFGQANKYDVYSTVFKSIYLNAGLLAIFGGLRISICQYRIQMQILNFEY